MLVIFDCDGVLVDSEALASEVFAQCLQKHGVNYSARECRLAFVGLTLDACIQKLKLAGHSLPAHFKAHLFAAEEQVFSKRLQPVVGVKKAVEQLQRQRVAYCVASNGSVNKVMRSLTITGLLPFFESCIFSAEQVSAGKPAPDLFNHAAESIGVDPSHCVVIEDSVAGVKAAVAAKMNVLRFGEEVVSLEHGRVLPSMEHLLPMISEFNLSAHSNLKE